MILNKFTPVQNIVIFAPRWHDRRILIAKFKVGQHNKLTFSKTKSLPGEYYLSGETIKKYPLESNGKIQCYAVDMNEMEAFERDKS